MSVEVIASSLPIHPISWNETLLGSGKTRLAAQTCLVAGTIIAALGYLGYLRATYAYATGACVVIVGLALPHLVRWMELRKFAGQIGQTTIDDMPPELLTLVFNYLPDADKLRISAVCKQWELLAGGDFILERTEFEGRTTFKIKHLYTPGNYHGDRQLVCARLVLLLKIKALSAIPANNLTTRRKLLVCRTIAKLRSTKIATDEAVKRLTRIQYIWFCFTLALDARNNGNFAKALSLIKRAEAVISNHYDLSQSLDDPRFNVIENAQDQLRCIAYAHME